MAISINRKLSSVIDGDGDIKGSFIDSDLVISSVSTVNTYNTIDDLPLVDVNLGTQALVTDPSPGDNALYVWNGSGWYRQSLINLVPSLGGLLDEYNLDSSGTSIQIITADPEGFAPVLSFQTIPSNITDSAFDINLYAGTKIIDIIPLKYEPSQFRLKVFSTDGANVISDSAVINYDGRKVLYFGDSASSSITADEGDTITIGLSTQGFSNGDNIPFVVTGTTDSSDISGAYTNTGSFVINDNFASISFTLDSDQTTEGAESMVWTLNSPEAWNSIPSTYTVNVNDTSVEPTYTLSAPANVNEGSALTITLTTTNVKNGVTVPYTITGIETADINGASLTGNFTVNNNTASVNFSITADYLTEGPQTLTLTLNGGLDSINVTINDTSTLGSITMTSNVTSVNEGSSVNFYATSTGVPNGYRLYWKLGSGSVSNPDVSNYTFSGNAFIEEGYVTFNNNTTNNISFTLAADLTTEGTEFLRLQATRLTTSGNTLVRNESSLRSVTINDTSITVANNYPTSFTLRHTIQSSYAEGISLPGMTNYCSNGANVFEAYSNYFTLMVPYYGGYWIGGQPNSNRKWQLKTYNTTNAGTSWNVQATVIATQTTYSQQVASDIDSLVVAAIEPNAYTDSNINGEVVVYTRSSQTATSYTKRFGQGTGSGALRYQPGQNTTSGGITGFAMDMTATNFVICSQNARQNANQGYGAIQFLQITGNLIGGTGTVNWGTRQLYVPGGLASGTTNGFFSYNGASMSGDGSRCIILNGTWQGAAFYYTRSSGASWNYRGRHGYCGGVSGTTPTGVTQVSDGFGVSGAISRLTGPEGEHFAAITAVGSSSLKRVYIYTTGSSNLVYKTFIQLPNTNSNPASVHFNDDASCLIIAYGYNSFSDGTIYVYERTNNSGTSWVLRGTYNNTYRGSGGARISPVRDVNNKYWILTDDEGNSPQDFGSGAYAQSYLRRGQFKIYEGGS